jgi:hypothetical protein
MKITKKRVKMIALGIDLLLLVGSLCCILIYEDMSLTMNVVVASIIYLNVLCLVAVLVAIIGWKMLKAYYNLDDE